ncbi:MAG: hypothetical protein NT157_02655 [Candidatus Micrarchaeota archaeon]|nr:hypothetical protein [Candidatus Micrarchaeota archaeon]
MESLVRFEGIVEEVLNELVEAGYFKTKSEALRAGILGLGKEYRILDELRGDLAYSHEFDRRIKAGEIGLGTESELRRIIKAKKGKT